MPAELIIKNRKLLQVAYDICVNPEIGVSSRGTTVQLLNQKRQKWNHERFYQTSLKQEF